MALAAFPVPNTSFGRTKAGVFGTDLTCSKDYLHCSWSSSQEPIAAVGLASEAHWVGAHLRSQGISKEFASSVAAFQKRRPSCTMIVTECYRKARFQNTFKMLGLFLTEVLGSRCMAIGGAKPLGIGEADDSAAEAWGDGILGGGRRVWAKGLPALLFGDFSMFFQYQYQKEPHVVG